MYPVLFNLGPIVIYSYGVFAAVGILIGIWISRRRARAMGISPGQVQLCAIWVIVAFLVSSKMWLVAKSLYSGTLETIPWLGIVRGGGSFYGGALGALLVLAWYASRHEMPALRLLDALSLGAPLGHAMLRVGCLAAGCCYGKPSTLPWSVVFSDTMALRLSGTPIGVHLHPTQIYEVVAELCNFAVLAYMSQKSRFQGRIFAVYALLYGIERFAIEFFRGDTEHIVVLRAPFSFMQIASVIVIVVGIYLYRYAQIADRRKVHAPDTSNSVKYA